MAMTTSSASQASRPLTRSEWVSTLPPWRRLLATLNWRPVYDIEQRTKLLEKEIALLKERNARIARFEQELFSSSNQTPSTGDSSPT
jgi:hypothetical protein